jgi:hypothetical protein
MDLKSYIDRRSSGRRLLRNRLVLTVFVLGVVAMSLLVAVTAGAYLNGKGQLSRDRITTIIRQVSPTNLISKVTERDSAQLMSIDLRIAFADLERLDDKRNDALAEGILLADESDLVPFELEADGRVIDGHLRLKGDWVDHLEVGKPSFRVELDDGAAFEGMSRFSLQHPKTRGYLNEWALISYARSLGLVAPRYGFINVTINGASAGIYAFEEHFTEEMLDGQQQRSGVILKWDEDALWEWRAESNWGKGDRSWSLITDVSPDSQLPGAFQTKKVTRDPLLQQQFDAGSALLRGWELGQLNASDVFDVYKLATFGALADIWGTKHGMYWHNLRFYFNPVTGLLEPVIFDMEPGLERGQFAANTMLRINNDRVISTAYIAELGRLSQPEEIDKMVAGQRGEIDRMIKALQPEFGRFITDPTSIPIGRSEAIRNGLNPGASLVAVRDKTIQQDASIYLRSIMHVPIEVLGFTVNDGPLQQATDALIDVDSDGLLDVDDSEIVLTPVVDGDGICPGPISCVGFSLVDVPADASIQVASRIVGAHLWSWTIVASLTQPADAPVVVLPDSPQQVVDAHEFVELDESNRMFMISAGTWNVVGDLFLPTGWGLAVEAGTTLRFGEGVVLRISGPLRLLGSAQNNVVLEASGQSWAGVAVIRAPVGSLIEHASIRQTTGIERGGWQLTGGVTFFESDVDIKNSQFDQSFAEDALNVVRSSFTLTDTSFSQTVSDAFDGDFADGVVTGGAYVDIGGDGIDLAGSVVDVTGVEFRQIGDKALSIGEASVVSVKNVNITDVALGVVSKDRSETDLVDSVISGASVAALAAYQKKPAYGPSVMNATGVQIDDSYAEVLIDRYSWIVRDGKRIDGTELDIAALYDAGILDN